MIRLPKWVLTNPRPSIYDSESATAIEMTAKLYQAMTDMIDEYNKFTENVEKNIEEFEQETNKDIQEFTVSLRQEFQDFIDVVEMKLQEQDKEIQNAYDYLVTNLNKTVKQQINAEIQNGTFEVGVAYVPETESLNMVATPQAVQPTKVQYDETRETITII